MTLAVAHLLIPLLSCVSNKERLYVPVMCNVVHPRPNTAQDPREAECDSVAAVDDNVPMQNPSANSIHSLTEHVPSASRVLEAATVNIWAVRAIGKAQVASGPL